MLYRFVTRFLGVVGVFTVFCLELGAEPATAQSLRPSSVVQTANLEGRIEFWILVFTKYGKSHRVFHHRDHPEIIYSVLDVSDFMEKLEGRQQKRAISKAIEDETSLIRTALRHLGKGGSPRNELENRIVSLFAPIRGGNKKYRIAAESKRIRIQTGIRERFRDGVRRSGRYLYAIERVFDLAGLPWEISRLPLVESSFDYNAYSSAGAAGIWQFIRSTGRRYLRISAAIDERRDPIVASQAAAQYLLNSYEKLGSWPLAITSYNHGLAGIMRAVKSTGSKDLSVIIDRYESRTFGFASQNFYCEFVAALEVEQNWQKYFPDLVIEQPWYVDEVRLPGAIHYRDLLRATGLSEDVFKKYNRALNKPVLSNRARIASDYVVKVPKGHGAALMANLGGGTQLTAENSWSYYQAKRVGKVEPSYAYYKVGSGDTVGRLAQKFGVSQSELMAMNGIRNPRHLRLGMKLKVPETQSVVVSSAKPAPQTIVAKAEKPTSYRVQKGETVSELAARFDISNSTLMAANGLTNARSLQAGQLLKVPSKDVLTDEEVMSEMSPAPPESYIVQSGETLSEISERFGVSVSKLKAANKLKNPRYLRAGAKLSIPSSGTGVAESKQKTHTVEAGDNLITIAERYGVTVDQLVEANNIKNPELLVVGKVIRVTPPLKSKPPESSENNYHVVQKGESLASISKSTGITVAELIKLNPDAGDLIYPSQRLRLNR